MNLSIIRMFSWFAAVVFFSAPHANASSFPLEITNIKPAGTGSPAIPATNRIFRAYPGVEYNIRAAVIGGEYPYTYSLNNAPSGMAINSRTGEISWPNPQSNSGTITLTVTDSVNTSVTTTWAITVSTTGFYFIDGSYSGTSTGSLSQPFKTILNMLESVTDKTAIVYIRGGMYNLEPFGESNDGVEYAAMADLVDRQPTNIGNSPFTWIGYPGETVNITGWGSIIAGNVYFDNLNFSNFISGYAIRLSSMQNYKTVRRCAFTDISSPSTVNHNQGFIFTRSAGVGHYFVIQDSSFSNFTGTSAIGSIYDSEKMLIENNSITNNTGGGVSGLNVAMALKLYLNNITVRGNKVVINEYPVFGSSSNSSFYGTDGVEICFNYFKRIGSQGPAHEFNTYGYQDVSATKNIFYHRNTVIGDIVFHYVDGNYPEKFGAYEFNDNVIVNLNQSNSSVSGHYAAHDYFSFDNDHVSMATYPWLAIGDTNNLKNSVESVLIDSRGNLQHAYSSLTGSRGWQFADGTTPMVPGQARRLSLGGRPIKLAEPGP